MFWSALCGARARGQFVSSLLSHGLGLQLECPGSRNALKWNRIEKVYIVFWIISMNMRRAWVWRVDVYMLSLMCLDKSSVVTRVTLVLATSPALHHHREELIKLAALCLINIFFWHSVYAACVLNFNNTQTLCCLFVSVLLKNSLCGIKNRVKCVANQTMPLVKPLLSEVNYYLYTGASVTASEVILVNFTLGRGHRNLQSKQCW